MTGKQLKNSILQWAIQGKLVPQDPNDEPASVLLEKIRQEKERLIKEKKIKRDKNASIIYRGEDNSYYEKILATGEVKCIDEEIPFDIPTSWEWCRLSCLTSILGDGIHGTPEYDNAGDIYFVNGN
ncbi:MAG: restriction endonuclease subunit S, partial [Bacteroidales bacterium]|nr:restriction endonuclease subunit S [Bacteroidales bacterium]